MDYAEFEAEYKRVSDLIINGPGDADLAEPVARLRALADQVDDEDDREEARWAVAGLEDSLGHDDEEPPSEIVQHARRIYAEAVRNEGSTADRLARAEIGVRELSRISGGSRDEEQAISDLSHRLDMLIDGFRTEMR